MANKTIKITVTKSIIGRKQDHIATVKALGLKKIRDCVELTDTPAIRGMVKKVSYLVDVTE